MRLTLFFTLFITTLQASALSLSLDRALELVEQNDLEIQMARYDSKIAKQETIKAESSYFGKLLLTQDYVITTDIGKIFAFKLTARDASFANFDYESFSLQLAEMINSGSADQEVLLDTLKALDFKNIIDLNFFQTKLAYTLPLYNGGRMQAGVTIAKSMQQIEGITLQELKNKKYLSVKKSFYDVALFNEIIAELEKMFTNMQLLAQSVESKIEAGYAKRVDRLQIKTQLAKIEGHLIEMRLLRAHTLDYLSFLVGEDVASIDFSPDTLFYPLQFHSLTIQHASSLQKSNLYTKISEEEGALALAGFLPKLTAYIEASSADSKFLGNFNEHLSYTIGAHFEYALFDGFHTIASLQEAKLKQMKMRLAHTMQERYLTLELAKLERIVRANIAKNRLLESKLAWQQEIVDNYTAQYEEKLLPINTVLEVQTSHLEKVLERQKLIHKTNTTLLELEYLTQ